VFCLLKTDLLTSDVLNGTGIDKSASNALKDGYSTPTKFVKLSITNVNLMTIMDSANHATKDTTIKTEDASSPQ
jgi:hypothetical protein